MELPKSASRFLFRIIVPAFPEVNIFTWTARKTTPLGPITVATAASSVWGWDVEIFDENNYDGPLNAAGLPDHEKLQKENPASVVGFYCGLSSTMDRVFELARFYHEHGTFNIAGGWHAHYLPKESLGRDIDIVIHGDADDAIRQILSRISERKPLADVPGISFMETGLYRRNPPEMLEVDLDSLPLPNFGLLRYPKKLKTYPINRIRGCDMNCEFCSVKGKPRWAEPERLFETVKWLVDTRGADYFFIVDDRLEENIDGTIKFFEMVAEKYGRDLGFTVQIRLESAKNQTFLKAMERAGVRIVCVGFESPIDEDLKAMQKGYLSKNMAEWSRILRRYFKVHGMFIFGYPHKKKVTELSVKEMIEKYKKFIREAQISTIQVLHPGPGIGSDLRDRLKREGRLFPLDVAPWSRYDGSYALFVPNNMTLAELQDTPVEIMRWFYSSRSFFRIPFRTLSFPAHYLIKGWQHWYYGWWSDVVKCGGYLLIKQWLKRQKEDQFLSRLEKYSEERKSNPPEDFPIIGG